MSRLFAVFKTALEGSCFLCKYFAKHYPKRYLYGQKKNCFPPCTPFMRPKTAINTPVRVRRRVTTCFSYGQTSSILRLVARVSERAQRGKRRIALQSYRESVIRPTPDPLSWPLFQISARRFSLQGKKTNSASMASTLQMRAPIYPVVV